MTTPPNSTTFDRPAKTIAAIDNTLTYYSTGLDANITVERGAPAPRTFEVDLGPAIRGFEELRRQLITQLTPFIDMISQIGAMLLTNQATQNQRAKVSRAWTDPQARWDMWDRKTHRTGRPWIVRGGRS